MKQIDMYPEPAQLVDPAAGAIFSPDRFYRYLLWRELKAGKGTCLWVMLNPSTADESVLDPTLRRCIRYTEDWGFHRMEVVNLFAFRSTDPAGLDTVADPVGDDNNEQTREAMARASQIIVGWGAHRYVRFRAEWVYETCCEHTDWPPLRCLGITKDGQPRHPLYLRSTATPMLWTLP